MRIPSATRPAHAGPKSSSSSFLVTKRHHTPQSLVRQGVVKPARQADVDALHQQLAAHLKLLQENPDAVWRALTRE
jgi:hypothetical protein